MITVLFILGNGNLLLLATKTGLEKCLTACGILFDLFYFMKSILRSCFLLVKLGNEN